MKCTWCEVVHDADFLCEPAREVLARLHERSVADVEKYNIPAIELTTEQGENVEGILCKAFAVRAFYTETFKVYRPGLAIEGVMLDDTRLKPLILVDTDINIRRAGRLFDDMAGLAVRRAKKASAQATGG